MKAIASPKELPPQPTMINIAILPQPMYGWYQWQGSDGMKQEDYTILGIGTSESKSNQCADIYHATHLLVLNRDKKLTWLGIGQLTVEPRE